MSETVSERDRIVVHTASEEEVLLADIKTPPFNL